MRTKPAVSAFFVALFLMLVSCPTAQADGVREGQWYLDTLRIAQAHRLSQGAGVRVGVIDTGIDVSHPDLKGVVKKGATFGAAKNSVKDPGNHGTGVASILAGQGHGAGGKKGILGIAPKATVISVGIAWTDDTKGEVGGYIGEAILYLVDKQHVDIITTSFNADSSDIAGEAIKYAADRGVVFVAAAGNNRNDDGSIDTGRGTQFPAAFPKAIPALGSTDGGRIWEGSVKPRIQDLALAAPSTDITVAVAGGGYENHDGTSISAPIVAGTYALVKARYPELAWADLADQVLLNATDAGKKGPDLKFGYGIVNPVRALKAKVSGHKPVALEDQGKAQEPGDRPSPSGPEPSDQDTPVSSSSPTPSVGPSPEASDQVSPTQSPAPAVSHSSYGAGFTGAVVVAIVAAAALISGVAALIRSRRRGPS